MQSSLPATLKSHYHIGKNKNATLFTQNEVYMEEAD